MKRVLMVLMCCFLAVIAAEAQEPQPQPEAKAPEAKAAEPLPTLDQILDKYVQALGGKAEIEKITSRQIQGVFELPAMGSSGTLQVYAKAPDKSALIIDVPGFGVIQQAYDGKVAWENNPMVGFREVTGPELAARKRDADFHRDIHLKDLYATLTVKGKEKIGERDAYAVEATPAEGKPEKMYFDTETGLLVRADAEREGPQGPSAVETYFEDYKEVDGVKEPHTIRQVMPAFTIVTKFTEIKHNVEIDDAKFAKPAQP